MKTIQVTLFAILLVFQPFISNAQETYSVDAGHTFVQFTVNRFSVVDVTGTFRDVVGSISYNPENPSETSASIVIKTASVESGLEAREGAIKSPAFLDVANYPEITFVSKKVEKSGKKLSVTGDLTIHGTTNEVTFPISIIGPYQDPTKAMTIGISGSLVINRQDFGIVFNRLLDNGQPFIGNEVTIKLDVLAFKE